MPLTKVASSMLASGASGSGGSAGKNYISSYNGNPCNGDFESGSISGWSVFSVSSITNGLPSGAPTTIAAGGSNPDITLVSPGSQLAGQYSLQASFPTTSQYKGFITEVFTIDAQDRAQVLTFGFHYQLTSSASNVNFSGTSSNTFIVSVYAVDGSNAGWIQPAGVYSMTQSSGAGFATGTFQTYSDTTQYRFAILCFNNPTTTSATVTFDDFSVGPTVVVNGTPVTDWVSYTPTLKGTSADPNIGAGSIVGRWRRVGDSLQVQCEATAGAGAASGTGNYYFTLPTGLVIDTARIALVSGSETITSLGSASIFNASVASAVGFPIVLSGITNGLGISNGGSAIGRDTPAATWWSSGDGLQINAQVPIVGWSSNVQISSDTDTRVVAFRATRATAQSMPHNPSPSTTIQFDSIKYDSHSSWDSTNFLYRVPVSGVYEIYGELLLTFGGNFGEMRADLLIDGSIGGVAQNNRPSVGGSTNLGLTYGFQRYLNAGQTIQIRFFQNNTGSGSLNLLRDSAGFGDVSSLYINRLSGPSVIAASETVAMTYTGTATGTLTTGGTNFLATVPTKLFDTHNAYASGLFTVPVSGKYQVYAQLQINAIYASGTTTARCEIRQAGSASTSIIGLQGWTSGASSNPTRPNTSIILNCIAGDTIAVYGGSDGGTLSYGAQCSVSIVRVGN
jgi:hypothetical protein